MVKKRALTLIVSSALLLGALAPSVVAQTAEPDAATTEESVMISQEELDSILARLADLAARVEALELGEAVMVPEVPTASLPAAPVAKGDAGRRFAELQPDPRRARVAWRDRASDEAGYRLYARRIYCAPEPGVDPETLLEADDFAEQYTDYVRVGKAAADTTALRAVHDRITKKLPPQPRPRYGSGEMYELSVAAFNKAGESERVPLATFITTPEWLCP